MKLKRSCSNCIRGTAIAVNNDILCREKGAVSADYVCSRHKFAPMPKTFKEMNYKCIDCENFILSIHSSRTEGCLGLCQMFTVRPFDGTQRNACSKFTKKVQNEVS